MILRRSETFQVYKMKKPSNANINRLNYNPDLNTPPDDNDDSGNGRTSLGKQDFSVVHHAKNPQDCASVMEQDTQKSDDRKSARAQSTIVSRHQFSKEALPDPPPLVVEQSSRATPFPDENQNLVVESRKKTPSPPNDMKTLFNKISKDNATLRTVTINGESRRLSHEEVDKKIQVQTLDVEMDGNTPRRRIANDYTDESAAKRTGLPIKTENSATMEPRSSQMLALGPEEDLDTKTAKGNDSAEGKKAQLEIQLPENAIRINSSEAAQGKELEDEPYYHGYMSREDAEKMTRYKGQFMVRRVALTDKDLFVITIFWKSIVHHFRIFSTTHQKTFWITKYLFSSVPDLIRYHHRRRIPIDVTGVELCKVVQRAQWQLYHDQVTNGKFLGKGAFGEVFAGTFTFGTFCTKKSCAVKTIPARSSSPKDKLEFLREANVMLFLEHPNIIQLYGVAALRDPIMIVMELAAGGCLLSRLRAGPTVTDSVKLRYTKEILKGMAYLERVEIIHRDLAARNILLDGSDVCKISDFGLSIKGKVHKEVKMCKVPIRWLAPETMMQGVFSSKTDVWSYGVTVWEIYADGAAPYGNIKRLKDVRQGVLKDNLKLGAPKRTPCIVQQMFDACFMRTEELRPTFTELKSGFKSGFKRRDSMGNVDKGGKKNNAFRKFFRRFKSKEKEKEKSTLSDESSDPQITSLTQESPVAMHRK